MANTQDMTNEILCCTFIRFDIMTHMRTCSKHQPFAFLFSYQEAGVQLGRLPVRVQGRRGHHTHIFNGAPFSWFV